MTSTDTYQLKWHSHSSHLNGSVASLLRSERFTDVVLCTMDGSQIPAHKFILSSCSVYLSGLFEGQRSVTRMGGMLYVVLPSEISTKALKILVEYMYKGETTVSNEVLDTVLKAGEVLKIRGLWRQTDEAGGDTPAEKTTTTNLNKQVALAPKKLDENQPKITIKKDDKLLKTFSPGQIQAPGGQVTRPMFIGPPKLVFIKTTEGGTQAALRPGAPKGQTILVASAPSADSSTFANVTPSTPNVIATTTIADDSSDEAPPPRILRRTERKYGKRQKTDVNIEVEETKDDDNASVTSKKSNQSSAEITTEIQVKDEPDWDASSIEEEERSIAEMFQAEMSVKSEPIDDMDIEEESLIYSPLACELCAEVFTVPAAWVRHVQNHASSSTQHARKRKHRSASDDTEETMALLRCDLCQKHFPNPAEWVRHIQSTHTETEPMPMTSQQQGEEQGNIVSRQEYHAEVQKYFKAHHDPIKFKKNEWTPERINKIIKIIEEYSGLHGSKRKMACHYYYQRKYGVLHEDDKKILILKPKTAKQRVRHIVPSSEYYELILQSHLSTNHGGREKVFNELNRDKIVPVFAVKIFIDMCKICKAKKDQLNLCRLPPNSYTVTMNYDGNVSRTSNIGYNASGAGNTGYVGSGDGISAYIAGNDINRLYNVGPDINAASGAANSAYIGSGVNTAGLELSIAGSDVNRLNNVGSDINVAGNLGYIVGGASNVGYAVSGPSNIGYFVRGPNNLGYVVSAGNNIGYALSGGSNLGYALCAPNNTHNVVSAASSVTASVSSTQLHSSDMAVIQNTRVEFTREKDKEPVEELATLSFIK